MNPRPTTTSGRPEAAEPAEGLSPAPGTPPPGRLPRRAALLGGVLALAATAATVAEVWPTPRTTPFRPGFPGSGLVTNEYAFHHPDAADARTSPDWFVTSGSLFARAGCGYTGVPDGVTPGPASAQHTDSAVFRLVTRRRDFADTTVRTRVLLHPPVTTPRTPAQDYDGGHVWVRYQSPQELYALSFRRRDGAVVIKRKTPGPGAADGEGGVYRVLAEGRHAFPYGTWHDITAAVRTTVSGAVHLLLAIDGHTVLEAEDPHPGSLAEPGGVGLRADNTELLFRDFTAEDWRT